MGSRAPFNTARHRDQNAIEGLVIAIRPRADQVATPGARITVYQEEPDDMIQIAEETTLPDRVALVEARRLTRTEVVSLTQADAVWLLAVLPGMIGAASTLAELPTDRLLEVRAGLAAQIAAIEGQQDSLILHQALVLALADVERAIAVHNARAVERTHARGEWPSDAWPQFLAARAAAIRSMRRDGQDFAEIAATLSLQGADHARAIAGEL